MANSLGAQLARPAGWRGRALGAVMRVANRRPTALAIEALGIQDGDTVLDLGCGFGDALPALICAAGTGAVHGVDHSEAVEVAIKRCPGAHLHRAEFIALPFADSSVDRVLAANVAYFWHEPLAVLCELSRVLRPGGRMALYVTDARHLRRLGPDGVGTHRLFTGETLREFLGQAACINPVEVGLGVRGWIATLDRIAVPSGAG